MTSRSGFAPGPGCASGERRSSMDVQRTSFDRKRGWTPALPAELDSEQTLIVAFGASDYLDDARPFDELRAAFPKSHVIGCSSAGEIAENRVHDGTVVVA